MTTGREGGARLDVVQEGFAPIPPGELERWEAFDLVYRTLCAILYNYAPVGGHPGGSISAGSIATALLFETLEYDLSRPDRADADALVYAAGHKALGMYALWALRDDAARLGARELLPGDARRRLRLEDLLGFRRAPCHRTPLFLEFGAKALNAHPTPAVPFVPLATAAPGVGLASALGLAMAAADTFGGRGGEARRRGRAPFVHILEGDGGLTAGRVPEALAFAATACLDNAVVHVDWNQGSADSDRVCREGRRAGDYVQWTPGDLFHTQGWNVVEVADGHDTAQVVAGQRRALELDNGRPTAVVYRTRKGPGYGLEGRLAHASGHALCSPGFQETLAPLLRTGAGGVPTCRPGTTLCHDGSDAAQVERCYWLALSHVRRVFYENPPLVEMLAGRVRESRRRLDERGRSPRSDAPSTRALDRVILEAEPASPPPGLVPIPGTSRSPMAQLTGVLDWLDASGGGPVLLGSADLLDDTGLAGARTLAAGRLDLRCDPAGRILSVGGVAEGALAAVLSGVAAFGRHLAVGVSWSAFLAPWSHVAVRLHALGDHARGAAWGMAPRPFILVCAHAGVETGQDGPIHADVHALQLFQGNFPRGGVITLTPWEPGEIWPLLVAALAARPSVVVPLLSRPAEPVLDRDALGLAPAAEATQGIYRLRAARGEAQGTLVLQGAGVTFAFLEEALPRLEAEGVEVDVWYVASAELFDDLGPDVQQVVFPESRAREAMGITGFTLPTLYRWVTGEAGRRHSLHPFRGGRYPGSGMGPEVLRDAGLDGEAQFRAIMAYVEERARSGVAV